jgi:hypothetical protein
MSTSAKGWDLWPILIGNQSLYDFPNEDYPLRWEIDPESLTPVEVWW